MSLTSHQQNQLVTDNMDLVGHIVAEVSARYPRHVDRAELWNAGALGLVEASRRFDPESGIPFARHAAIRIRGAIIDSTRTRDWASRSVRRNIRDIQQAQSGLEEQHGKTPVAEELCIFPRNQHRRTEQASGSGNYFDPASSGPAERGRGFPSRRPGRRAACGFSCGVRP